MLGQIIRRIFTGAIVLWITTTLIYLGLGLAPGDELDARLGPEVAATLTPEDVQAMRAELGLDRPLPIRYTIWLSKVVQGDLGYSSSEDMNVTEALRQRVGATAMLVVVALFFGTIFGILIGIWAAVRENTWVDYILGSIPIFIAGIPGFILALFFIYTISVKLDLLPTSDMHDLGDES